MSCGCRYQRAGGRYLDERAGGTRPGAGIAAAAAMQQGPGAGRPTFGAGLGPQKGASKCWLPQDVVTWFRQDWVTTWMRALDNLEATVPVIGPILADIGGGGVVVRQLITLIRSGCDLASYTPDRLRLLAQKLTTNADFFQNGFVIVALDGAGVVFLGGFTLGTAMNALAPVMRCAARALLAMVDGQVAGACLFAGCIGDMLNILQGFGVRGAEMVPELRAQLDQCAQAIKDAPAGAFGLPTIGEGAGVSAATGEDISGTRDIGAQGAGTGAGLIPAALLGYLFFLR